jgi:polysaccharide chain length determinant protein (PEP-CTERM system associated)
VVPGKKYAPEDYLKIVWRRKWLITIPLVLAAIGTFLYSRTLPDRYRSEATVLIIPQQIPENFIQSTVDETIAARLDLMRQQILSRSRLERIIEEFDLYRDERKVMLMDQIVEQMRRDVGVSVQKVGRRQDPNHFVVSFDSENPETAMQVAARVASLFVRENVEGRNLQSEATTQYLQSQVDETLRQLQAQEGRLEAFRQANAGRLPTEVETNIELMANTRQQIQTLNEGINRDREQQISTERMIADEMTLGPAVSAGKSGAAGDAQLPASQQLAAARANLQGLLTRLKEDHPDVRILRGRIKSLEERAEAEALQQPLGTAAALTPAEAERQKRLSQLRGEQQRLDREIKAKQAVLKHTQGMLAQQEQRVQAAPGLQSQLADMTRGYDTLRGSYENLLGKLQSAKLASSLEQRQVSQQLRIVDPARRPNQPHSPDRVRMNLIGALMGLGFGLAIAGLLEYRDTSLRTEEDVLVALSLPVLALVPTMITGKSVRQGRRRRLLLFGSSAGALALSLAAAVWQLRLFEGWGG